MAILNDTNSPIVLRSKNDILFVEVDMLEELRVLEYSFNFKAVIIHNGDNELSNFARDSLISSGVKIFATNLKSTSPLSHTIPIGLENAHYGRNGSIHYYNPINISKVSCKKDNDLLVSISVLTNPAVRAPLISLLQKSGYKNETMSLFKYRSSLANARFVVSPPGNGIDCHRTWEAFYHKTVPIIEKRYWYFDEHDLPVLLVDKFEDFLHLTEEERCIAYSKIIDNKYYPAIYCDYWFNFILSNTLVSFAMLVLLTVWRS